MRRSLILCSLLVLFSLSGHPALAATITDFVETENSLSFDFSGEGFDDFAVSSLPPLTFWEFGIGGEFRELHGQDPQLGRYGFAFLSLEHLTDGPVGPVNLGNISPSFAAYGTILSDLASAAHGTGEDRYFMRITVNDNGSGEWGTFSGSFDAFHGTAVPDVGSTGLLTGLSFLLLLATSFFNPRLSRWA